MEIIEIDIDKIAPDKNQPRTIFDPKRIQEMAQSMLTEGIINPIEVDLAYVIVTGEQRWRAAIVAGFTKVPIKIINPKNPHDRFRRQVIENVHHNTMTVWDTGMALSKLLSAPPGGMDRDTKGRFSSKGFTKLANEIGKSQQWVSDMVQNTLETGKVKKYLQSEGAKYSLIREIKRQAPEEVREQLKEKVVEGTINHRVVVSNLIDAIKEYPEKTEELLNEKYNEPTEKLNVQKIYSIAPPTPIGMEMLKKGSKIVEKIVELLHLLKITPQEDILPADRKRMQKSVDELIAELAKLQQDNEDFIEGEIVEEPKKLKSKTS